MFSHIVTIKTEKFAAISVYNSKNDGYRFLGKSVLLIYAMGRGTAITDLQTPKKLRRVSQKDIGCVI